MGISKGARERIERLSASLDVSLELSGMLNEFLKEGKLGCDPETVDTEAQGLGISRADYYRHRVLLELGLDQKVVEEIIGQGRLDAVELDPARYLNDPFISRLGELDLKKGKYRIKLQSFEPMESFLLKDVSSQDASKDYAPQTVLGYFPQGYTYPELLSRNRIWMSGSPYEVETMAPYIGKAHGKVLTLGLGLGYFACSALLSNEVKSVTAVESSPEVIELFESGIQPKFERKVDIVRGDALKFLSEHGKEYDYIFADLWHDEQDGTPVYCDIKAAESKLGIFVDCWIEPTILTFLRECAIQALTLIAYGERPDGVDGAIVQGLYRALKRKDFRSAEDVDAILSDGSLRAFAIDLGNNLR